MKSKILSLFLLTVIVSLVIVNAADFTVSLSNPLSKSINKTTLTITNTNISKNITVAIPNIADISDGDSHTIIIDQSVSSGNYIISAGGSMDVVISYSSFSPSGVGLEDLALGDFSETVNIISGNDSSSVDLRFLSGFCELGEKTEKISDGKRYLEITSVKDQSSDSDWEWKPLDSVDIDVTVKFISDDNDDSIDGIIELGLYDTETNEFIDFENDSEIDFSLDEGEKTTETITVGVPVEDIEDSSSRYKLYVKAYEDGDEDIVCTSLISSDSYKDIEIQKESYAVVLNNIDVTSPVPCGNEVEVTARVFNTGNNDEDQVKINLYNKELGIDLDEEIMGLDEGESAEVHFNFLLPLNTTEKVYKFNLYTYYRYKKSSDTYSEESSGDTISLKVEGNCKSENQNNAAQITASLDQSTPQAIAGKQVIINGVLKNTGNVETTYSVSVLENSLWSTLDSIDPQTIILKPGESKDFNIILNVDKDAEGEKEFTIKASYNGESNEQKVALTITKTQTIGSGIQPIINHLKANWLIYVIVLINLILIIAIIIVAKRIASGRRMTVPPTQHSKK
jgi:hypothetical protein